MIKDTIEIRVNGEEKEVTLVQPLGFTFMRLAITMPEEMTRSDFGDEGTDASVEVVDWVQKLTKSVTDLSEEELDGVHPEDMERLIEASTMVFAGENPPKRGSDFKVENNNDPFEGLDLDEDGTIDPGDFL